MSIIWIILMLVSVDYYFLASVHIFSISTDSPMALRNSVAGERHFIITVVLSLSGIDGLNY